MGLTKGEAFEILELPFGLYIISWFFCLNALKSLQQCYKQLQTSDILFTMCRFLETQNWFERNKSCHAFKLAFGILLLIFPILVWVSNFTRNIVMKSSTLGTAIDFNHVLVAWRIEILTKPLFCHLSIVDGESFL